MPLWAVLVWLAVWQLIAWWVDAPILLVSPLTALKRLLELAFEAAFWRAVAFSVGRILLGFLLSALLGAVLAAAACVSCSCRWWLRSRRCRWHPS